MTAEVAVSQQGPGSFPPSFILILPLGPCRAQKFCIYYLHPNPLTRRSVTTFEPRSVPGSPCGSKDAENAPEHAREPLQDPLCLRQTPLYLLTFKMSSLKYPRFFAKVAATAQTGGEKRAEMAAARFASSKIPPSIQV